MSDAFLSAVKTVVLPDDESSSPINHALHAFGDGNAMANQICRVVAEIRTRTSIVLALYLQDIEFAKKFIEHCGYSIDMLKSLAKDCHTGEHCILLFVFVQFFFFAVQSLGAFHLIALKPHQLLWDYQHIYKY